MSVVGELERFVVAEIAAGAGVESVAPDEDLLASGIVDSLGLMEVVGFLEQRYGIEVTDDDLLPENFETLERIAALVESKAAR